MTGVVLMGRAALVVSVTLVAKLARVIRLPRAFMKAAPVTLMTALGTGRGRGRLVAC